ncbi:hypothetical protein FACS1894208_05500 [Clostridia bacterium]|nr:hypothetical protein FACS1894208_05500 [Clostridia bacterium]
MATAFFQRIEALCLDKGISTTKLASAVGVGEATISGWRKGAAPRNNTIAQLASFFGVSPAYIAGKSNDPVDYANIDTSGFNQVVFRRFIDEANGDEKQAVKRYLDYEKARDQDALNDDERLAIYQNSGIVGVQGHAHAPVKIVGSSEHTLSGQETQLLRIFAELDEMQRAKVLIYAGELKDKQGAV